MQENINDKLTKIMSGLGKNGDSIRSMLSSREGQKLKNSLSESDKKALMEKFLSLDAAKVRQSLKNADLSQLNGLSAEDILKKLK